MENRVNELEIDIDCKKVKDFFDDRKRKDLPHRYNYVNYQDNQPELVLERDTIEKERISGYFPINYSDMVLDIGCGVGRWGDLIVPIARCGRYVGIDYTQYFIEIAQAQFKNQKNVCFIHGAFQNLCEILKKNNEYRMYNKILINGVLMYINDMDIEKCLDSADNVLDYGGMLYLKESVGIKNRLTLTDFPSKELGTDYSVIYRSLSEYTSMIGKIFIKKGYSLISCGGTWESKIDFTKETSNWYWILWKQ